MAEIDLSKSVMGFVPCVEFRWGSQVRRYCRADIDHTFDGETYTAVPAMDIEMQMQDGGTEAKPFFIIVPLDVDPIDKMIAGTFAEVEVTVKEADFTAVGDSMRIAIIGVIRKTKARFRGKTQTVRVECVGRKFFLKEVSLGIKTTDRCPWFFGDHVCGAAVVTHVGTVASITGTSLTMDTLAGDDLAWGQGRYTRGFVQDADGLSILIRFHHAGTRTFTLSKAPPQATNFTWVNSTVTVFAGCDKTIEACEFWNREERFGGLGLLMPKYNPMIERPPD